MLLPDGEPSRRNREKVGHFIFQIPNNEIIQQKQKGELLRNTTGTYDSTFIQRRSIAHIDFVLDLVAFGCRTGSSLWVFI